MDVRAALAAHCLAAARGIAADCRAGDPGLAGCGAPVVALLRRQAVLVTDLLGGQRPHDDNRLARRLARRLADLVELAHARFYAYPPRDLPACWRQLYTDASILQFCALRPAEADLCRDDDGDDDDDDAALDRLVRPLDLALILAGGAGPPARGRVWIHAALDMLGDLVGGVDGEDDDDDDDNDDDNDGRPEKRRRTDSACCRATPPRMFPPDAPFVPPVRHPVPRAAAPLGLEAFQAYLDGAAGAAAHGRRSREPPPLQPLLLPGLTDDWPARQPPAAPRWARPAYLRAATLRGRRLVPVEVGRSYVDPGWTQSVVPVADVLRALQGPSAPPPLSPPVYLAQHALFAQVPRLRDDIRIPDACYSSPPGGGPDENPDENPDNADIAVNAWIGPPGTITPLHTDPHHNLLAQVVGRKYVRLYAPDLGPALRPRGREGGVDMANTSAVDVGVFEGWDAGEDGDGDDDKGDPSSSSSSSSASLRRLPYLDCILAPGDTLYIPRGWWHYVRGLSVSFSVSFWWD